VSNPTRSGEATWEILLTLLWMCYFWRRRWWYGFPTTRLVPAQSPPGLPRLFLECLAITLLTVVAGGLLVMAAY